jgi:FkbM family methyltransferase
MQAPPPYGTYAPGVLTGLTLALTRHTPLGRGQARKQFARLVRTLNAGHPLDVSLYGGRARLHHTGNLSEMKALLNPARYAREEYAFCRKHMPRDGGTFLDIGGNAGVFSLFVASLMRSGTILIAEPQPSMLERLETNLTLNPELEGRLAIHVLRSAIGGDAPGTLTLSVPDSAGQASARPVAGVPTLDVPVVPMKAALEERGVDHLDLLKLDVEGYEDDVIFPFFETAEEQLWPTAIVMECCHAGRWKRDCDALLKDCGYAVIRRDRTNMMLLRT